MSDGTGALERLRAWTRWFLYGDLSLDWLRPRRAVLPALLTGTLVALVVLHRPSGPTNDCTEVGGCLELIGGMAESEPGVLAGTVGLHVLAAALVYLVSVGATALVGRLVDVEAVAPWLFAPDDATYRGVIVVGFGALLAYVAGAYILAYSVVGLGALYVLYFPVFTVLTGLVALDPIPQYLHVPIGITILAALPLLEVGWLYALAHLAASPFDSEDDHDRSVHH